MIPTIGLGSSLGGNVSGSEGFPNAVKQRDYLPLDWRKLIVPSPDYRPHNLGDIADLNLELACAAYKLARSQKFFFSVGGDHSCALGTWSGVAEGIRPQGNLGLIWIDAHMDSHTPETSETGNVHGMPVAALMGYGDSRLTRILSPSPKVRPEHLALIGVRSYESGEAALLDRLGVRVYPMVEVIERGFDVVLKAAVNHVSAGTAGYGISFDIDSLDPEQAPAVGCPVAGGLLWDEVREAMLQLRDVPPRALEIVEYISSKDPDGSVLDIVEELIEVFSGHANANAEHRPVLV